MREPGRGNFFLSTYAILGLAEIATKRNILNPPEYVSRGMGDVEAWRPVAGVDDSLRRQQMIRFRKHAGTSGRLQGCRPSAAFAAPRLTGLAPNVTFGSGVGTGRPGCGVGNRVSQASRTT